MLFSADDADKNENSRETDPFAGWQPGDTCYEWQANGMLAGVRTPDGRTVTFGYDALGRRISKRTDNTVHRFGWDGNVVLHEWDTDEARRPMLVTDETGREEYNGTEKPEGLVTWIYDGTSFTPVAKVTDGERYTIVHDYLGTPTQAYDSKGELVWEMLLDVYGRVAECHGDRTLVPFRYQGQYEDEETGLYYNRFRYYSPDMGMYISSDPIGLAGNNPTLYGYVEDVNTWLDVVGLFNVNPKNIFYSQDSIKDTFRDGTTLQDTIAAMKVNPKIAENIEPIRIIKLEDLPTNIQKRLKGQGANEGDYFSLDNRRLYAAKEAGVDNINARMVTAKDLRRVDLNERFSTKNAGRSIEIRCTK